MRQAVSRKRTLNRVVTSRTIPAPVRGWNARDALAQMKDTDAVYLDNWFPRTADCIIRPGFEEWATGMSGSIQTLMEYASPTVSQLKAVVGGKIYDVSGAGAVTAAEASGFSNSRLQYVNFGTPAGNYLVVANGTDSVRVYNGSAWSVPSITSATSSTFIHVNAHKNRLWFTPTNSMTPYYLGTSAIAGTATGFPLAQVATKGGYLMAMATWTVDGGSGLDDLAVFITSNGEAIIYAGTDPASAATWNLIGVFQIGRPIGRRCFVKFGGDVIVITEDGFLPLSKALQSSRGRPTVAVSDRIINAVSQAARDFRTNFGWEAILYPQGSWLLFNIPRQEGLTSDQYVMNTQTGAWCRFTDMNANCWALLNENLYFGGTNSTYKADSGEDDDGDAIDAYMKLAFNYYSSQTSQKRWTMIRPIFFAGSTVTPTIEMNVDYEDSRPMDVVLSQGGGGTPWGSPWGSPWGNAEGVRKDWQSLASNIGFCAAPYMGVSTMSQSIQLLSFDVLVESGGYL